MYDKNNPQIKEVPDALKKRAWSMLRAIGAACGGESRTIRRGVGRNLVGALVIVALLSPLMVAADTARQDADSSAGMQGIGEVEATGSIGDASTGGVVESRTLGNKYSESKPGTDGTEAVDLTDAQLVYYTRSSSWTKSWYFNRSETRRFAYGGTIPNLKASSWGFTMLSWIYIGLSGHRIIAKWWYRRGYCVGFRLSFVPWRGNGMFGYRC